MNDNFEIIGIDIRLLEKILEDDLLNFYNIANIDNIEIFPQATTLDTIYVVVVLDQNYHKTDSFEVDINLYKNSKRKKKIKNFLSTEC